MQKKAVRTITGAKYNAYNGPLFKRLNILDSLVRYNKLIFMQQVNDFLSDVFVNFVLFLALSKTAKILLDSLLQETERRDVFCPEIYRF